MTMQIPQPERTTTPREELADLEALLKQAPDLAPLLAALIDRLRTQA